MKILNFQYFFDQFNASLQIETEINEHPLDSFALIFFLFEYEHVMIEKLLQLFVDKVDPLLFETVKLKKIWKFEKWATN